MAYFGYGILWVWHTLGMAYFGYGILWVWHTLGMAFARTVNAKQNNPLDTWSIHQLPGHLSPSAIPFIGRYK